jgi:hypothetical protein
MKKKKVKLIMVSEETFERFKAIKKELHYTADITLLYLIDYFNDNKDDLK